MKKRRNKKNFPKKKFSNKPYMKSSKLLCVFAKEL